MTSDTEWLQLAIDLASDNVAGGGGPFGSVVVLDGEEVARGSNRVTLDNDATAHAEVVAIRRAGQRLDTHSLAGCVLYASCEPCPMCASSALWARVDRVCFAADRHDAKRAGFDDAALYRLFSGPHADWPMEVTALRLPDAEAPFDAWLALEGRAEY